MGTDVMYIRARDREVVGNLNEVAAGIGFAMISCNVTPRRTSAAEFVAREVNVLDHVSHLTDLSGYWEVR